MWRTVVTAREQHKKNQSLQNLAYKVSNSRIHKQCKIAESFSARVNLTMDTLLEEIQKNIYQRSLNREV